MIKQKIRADYCLKGPAPYALISHKHALLQLHIVKSICSYLQKILISSGEKDETRYPSCHVFQTSKLTYNNIYKEINNYIYSAVIFTLKNSWYNIFTKTINHVKL